MLTFLQELRLITEASESTEESKTVKEAKPYLNKISMMLFGRKCEPVVDEKRSKEAKFFGVSNGRSKLTDAKGKAIRLTFDNSTDSGEFEINSLTPLHIVHGESLDKAIKALYKKHKVHSKKKMNYLDVEGDLVLREIHIGSSPDEAAVKLVRDVIKLIRGETVEDDEEPKKEEKPKDEIKESSLNEAIPLLKDLLNTNLRGDECFVVKAYVHENALEIDDFGGIKVYAQGSLKQCQNWILKNPKYIGTIIDAKKQMKSHKVPDSYKIESVEEQDSILEATFVGVPKVILIKAKINLHERAHDTYWALASGKPGTIKSADKIIDTMYSDDILVKSKRDQYHRISDGIVQKDFVEISVSEINKLGSALKVVLKDK